MFGKGQRSLIPTHLNLPHPLFEGVAKRVPHLLNPCTRGTMIESQVKERLRKIRSGAQFGNIQLRDVREALTDEALLTPEGLLTANDNGV